jgi:uncharacterized protein
LKEYFIENNFSFSKFFFIFLLCNSGCSWLFFYPTQNYIITPEQLGFNYKDLKVVTDTGTTLRGWDITSKDLVSNKKPVIIYFHGNAQNISIHLFQIEWLVRKNFRVILFDYSGFGKSGGVANPLNIVEDGKSIITELVKNVISPDRPIIIYGQSLGGYVALGSVAGLSKNISDKIKLIIIESTFFSFQSIARDTLSKIYLPFILKWPIAMLVGFYPNNCTHIKKIPKKVELLLIHGKSDTIIPPEHSKLLLNCANDDTELWLIEGRDHLEIFNTELERIALTDKISSISK